VEELHYRIKNLLATVLAITSQSLENADSVEHGREAIEHRLRALGRVQDLLLKVNWESASLSSIVQTALPQSELDCRLHAKAEEKPPARTPPEGVAGVLNGVNYREK
jgi:two-component sensor histidine kinase